MTGKKFAVEIRSDCNLDQVHMADDNYSFRRHWSFYFSTCRAIERAEKARQAYLMARDELAANVNEHVDADPVFGHLLDAYDGLQAAQLLAGITSEVYITQYIFDRFKGQDYSHLEKMSTVAKWRFAPALANKVDGFQFGGQVLNGLDEVRKVRDKLVHHKPNVAGARLSDDLADEIKATKRLVNHVVYAISELHKIDPKFGIGFVDDFLKAL